MFLTHILHVPPAAFDAINEVAAFARDIILADVGALGIVSDNLTSVFSKGQSVHFLCLHAFLSWMLGTSLCCFPAVGLIFSSTRMSSRLF